MISVFVTGQKLQIAQPLIASDTIDYLTASFFFRTSDWDGLSKWAHFKQGETAYSVLLIDGKISKDAHLNLGAGDWEVYLHGTSEQGMRITTEVQKISVVPSGVIEGKPLGEIPPSVAEQIDQKASNAVKIAQSVRDDANAGKFKGDKGDKGETGKTPIKGVDYWTPEDEKKLDSALSLAKTNEEDIRLNEIDITNLNAATDRLNTAIADAKKELEAVKPAVMPKGGPAGYVLYKKSDADYDVAWQEIVGVENGATFTPTVSPEGVLSWSNDKGLANPPPVNIKGSKGDPGKTPVKGVDYWTEQDKQEMIQGVLQMLPKWNGGVY